MGAGETTADRVCVHALVERQAALRPEAAAATFEGEVLTYAELARRSDRLAARLQRLGAGPEVLVAVQQEPGLALPAAVLGILKSGAAYLPVGLEQPAERLRLVLADAGCRLAVASPALGAALGAAGVLAVPVEWEGEAGRPAGPAARPWQLAYVIYTSGSTGRPKGVMVEHLGLANLALAQAEAFGLGPGCRVLQFASIGFDASVSELLVTLAAGATVCLAPRDALRPGPDLARTLRRERITTVTLPPSALAVTPPDGLPELRTVVSAGELCPPELVDRWAAGRRFLNAYGPTEATVCATVHACRPGERPVPVGRPLANVRAEVLDGGLRPVPAGRVGELCLGGAGLARGYLGGPGLTAAAFVPDPTGGGRRLYRTGDLARRLQDGALDVRGRADRQLKLRGYRIEPAEVEAAIRRQPGVGQALVVAGRDPTGEECLVGYLVSDREDGVRIAELRSRLAAALPAYMIPSAFVPLNALPTTPNGKPDLAALPPPDPGREGLGSVYVAPRTPLERLLTGICEELLGIERVGLHDDFFELGGTSLRAARYLARLQEVFDAYVYVVALLDTTTAAGLADYLRAQYPEAVARVCPSELPAAAGHAAAGREIDEARLLELRRLIAPRTGPRRRAARPNAPAAFVLSPPRSGSTLLRVMLAGHPRLFAPPELELLSFASLGERRRALTGRFAFWLEGTVRAVMEALGCGAEEAQRVLSEHEERDTPTQELYGLLQRWVAPRLLVDKTPSYALHRETLEQAELEFEGARYVHLCRHPLGMIGSFVEARNDQVFFRQEHPYTVRELGELVWVVCHRNIQAFLEGVPRDRWCLLRYEDLTVDPEPEMRRVCELLGLDLDPEMLRPYANQERKMTDGIHPMSRMLGDVRFHEHRDIDPAVAHSWRARGPDRLSAPAARLAEALGYAVEEQHVG